MRVAVACTCAAVVLGTGLCGKKKNETPAECTADQTRVGDECMDRVGPTACGGLLAQDGDGCVENLPDCGDGQIYTVAGCLDVGEDRDCGTGDWGGIDTSGSVVFVDGAYTGGGSDGTESRPFVTIAEALAVAASGDKVAVAQGTYAENLAVPTGVTLEGRCAEMVTVEGSGGPAVSLDGADGAAIVGITIHGDGPGIVISSSDDVTLEQLVVESTMGAGVHVRSGQGAIIGDCGIYGTQYSSDDLPGDGLLVDAGAGVEAVTGAIFGDNAYAGIEIAGSAAGIDSVLATGNDAAGVVVDTPTGEVRMSGSRILGNGWAGIIASGAGSVVVESCVVEGTTDVTTSASANGDGVIALGGAALDLAGSIVRENARFGVVVGGSTGIIGDCGIYGNGQDPRADTSAGGIAVMGSTSTGERGTLEVTNSTIADNTGGGLLSWTSDVTVTDTAITGNAPRSAGTPEGDGIMASTGTHLTATRALVDGTGGGRLGVLVDGSDSTGIIGDCGIEWTEYGGIWFQENAGGSVGTSVIAAVRFTGVGLVRGAGSTAPVEIAGSTIAQVGPGVGLSEAGTVIDWGDGVTVMAGSSANVTGNTVKGADRAGILFDAAEGSVTDNTIEGGDFGIAVQHVGAGSVTGATTSANSISGASQSAIAEDQDLPIDTSGWSAGI